jgi:hypothetical protein
MYSRGMRNERLNITFPCMESETSILCSQVPATISILDQKNTDKKLTPWSIVLPKDLTILWIVKTFYGTRRSR